MTPEHNFRLGMRNSRESFSSVGSHLCLRGAEKDSLRNLRPFSLLQTRRLNLLLQNMPSLFLKDWEFASNHCHPFVIIWMENWTLRFWIDYTWHFGESERPCHSRLFLWQSYIDHLDSNYAVVSRAQMERYQAPKMRQGRGHPHTIISQELLQ